MATTFEVKYYELATNSKGDVYEKIVVDKIKARIMELQNGMVVFYDNGSGKVMKAAYSKFISVKEV